MYLGFAGPSPRLAEDWGIGRITVKRAPPSALFVAEISPPWALQIRWLIERPSPSPLELDEMNGSKISAERSTGMPGPVSLNAIRTPVGASLYVRIDPEKCVALKASGEWAYE